MPESAATRNQLYAMRTDGGEARRISDAKEGVLEFAFSDDGGALVFLTLLRLDTYDVQPGVTVSWPSGSPQ